jgi:hypothetical protein
VQQKSSASVAVLALRKRGFDVQAFAVHFPNYPVVVEGYAETGMPGQSYVLSRQRASDVRQYLESRFHLKPELVGIMPLADHPPPGTGKSTWDGVCLALVVSK